MASKRPVKVKRGGVGRIGKEGKNVTPKALRTAIKDAAGKQVPLQALTVVERQRVFQLLKKQGFKTTGFRLFGS